RGARCAKRQNRRLRHARKRTSSEEGDGAVDRTARKQLHDQMVRLADGDRAAFEPLYEALWPVVRGFALRVLAGPEDAEDAAQRAMMAVFARASEFDSERDALSWILGITAYECRTSRQRGRRRRECHDMDALDGVVATDASPEETAIARDLIAA